MIGTVWFYDEAIQEGYIIGNDGRRYSFPRAHYRHTEDPIIGAVADFKDAKEVAQEIKVVGFYDL